QRFGADGSVVGHEAGDPARRLHVEAAAQQVFGGLVPARAVGVFQRAVATLHQRPRPPGPVVLALLGQRLERRVDRARIELVHLQFLADPQRPIAAAGPAARQADGEAGVVLPALLAHQVNRPGGLRLLHAAGGELALKFAARVFAPHQQAQRPLGGAGFGLLSPGPLLRQRAQATASSVSSSSAVTGAGISCSRICASRRAATSGLSLRYWRAFSLPLPMRSSPMLYQAPAFCTSLASTPMSISSPSRLMPCPQRISVITCLKGGAILFLTTLIRVWLPMISSPFLIAPMRRMSRRTEA